MWFFLFLIQNIHCEYSLEPPRRVPTMYVLSENKNNKKNPIKISFFASEKKKSLQDKLQDTEVLKKAGMKSIHTVLKLAQLRWTGHVIKMPNERLPKKNFYGELQDGKRSEGDQKNTLQIHPQSLTERLQPYQ